MFLYTDIIVRKPKIILYHIQSNLTSMLPHSSSSTFYIHNLIFVIFKTYNEDNNIFKFNPYYMYTN